MLEKPDPECRKWAEGRTIIRIRSLTADELVGEYWRASPVVAIELDDGSILFPSCDIRGSGPGVLFGRVDGSQVYVWPNVTTVDSSTV